MPSHHSQNPFHEVIDQYLAIFQPDTPFKIRPTSRYTSRSAGKLQCGVFATVDLEPGVTLYALSDDRTFATRASHQSDTSAMKALRLEKKLRLGSRLTPSLPEDSRTKKSASSSIASPSRRKSGDSWWAIASIPQRESEQQGRHHGDRRLYAEYRL